VLLRETTFQLHAQKDGGEARGRQSRALKQFIEVGAVRAKGPPDPFVVGADEGQGLRGHAR
jgi:hypothetical protein